MILGYAHVLAKFQLLFSQLDFTFNDIKKGSAGSMSGTVLVLHLYFSQGQEVQQVRSGLIEV